MRVSWPSKTQRCTPDGAMTVSRLRSRLSRLEQRMPATQIDEEAVGAAVAELIEIARLAEEARPGGELEVLETMLNLISEDVRSPEVARRTYWSGRCFLTPGP